MLSAESYINYVLNLVFERQYHYCVITSLGLNANNKMAAGFLLFQCLVELTTRLLALQLASNIADSNQNILTV